MQDPSPCNVVAIASSLGGIDALRRVFRVLPAAFPAAILVVQHRSPQARRIDLLVEALQPHSNLEILLARGGERIVPSRIYLAPTDMHLFLQQDLRLRCSDSEAEGRFRPSADVLMRSVARACGPRAIAVVLTGRLSDGANGAAAIRDAGGKVIIEDPMTAIAPQMPQSAIDLCEAKMVLPLDLIGRALISLISKSWPLRASATIEDAQLGLSD